MIKTGVEMEFCEKCGNLMIVKKGRKNVVLICKACGRKKTPKGQKIVLSEKLAGKKKEIVIMSKGEEMAELPKTKMMCPKCEHVEAYWWMQQTRAADEPPTLFYKCTKCGYSWRSYG
jgi:DNA-directed RNA polymerase subunit M